MELRPFSEADITDWQTAVDRTNPSPSPLAGPEFIATTIRGWEKTYILRVGNTIIPLAKGNSRMLKFLNSDYYTGVPMFSLLGMTDLDHQLTPLLKELSGNWGIEIEFPTPLYDQYRNQLAACDFVESGRYDYHVVPLPKTYDEWFSRHSVKRYSIRRAQNAGVKITLGGRELVQSAYEMYSRSFERWRDMKTASTQHEYARFLRIFEMPGSRARVGVAEYDGKVVASVIFCYYRRAAAYLYGGLDYDYKKIRANTLLQAEIIRHLIDHGIQEYNLGTSLGLEDLESFKESIGGERHQAVTLVRHRYPRIRRLLSILSPARTRR